jgi:hypothetical protein
MTNEMLQLFIKATTELNQIVCDLNDCKDESEHAEQTINSIMSLVTPALELLQSAQNIAQDA